jgi:hypothetical protein
MAFDYTTLINPVRRLVNDLPTNAIELNESTTNSSTYIVLSEDGYATPVASGVVINGVPIAESAYTVTKNVIQVDTTIAAESEVFVQYDWVTYTDEHIISYIDDTIHYVIEPCFGLDFEFGDTVPAPSGIADPDTYTAQDFDQDYVSLMVWGSALSIMGVKLTEAGDDAIYIKDGDTVIDTAASSREKARGYAPLAKRYNDLKNTLLIRKFEGATMY